MSQEIKHYSIILIEDHSIFIEGLLSVLRKIGNTQVLGAFDSGQEALDFLEQHHADIVFLDISLPGSMSGIEICSTIHRLYKQTKVIALSNHTERQIINDMLGSGANGYLLKNASLQDLENAIELVMLGQCVMSDEVRGIVFSAPDRSLRPPRLTAREKEVLHWIGEGLTTSAIASKLFITIQTVESHRYNLLQKFEAPNAVVLVKKAIALGLMKAARP
ncbi:response regulator [Chitinophaga alhagiae]|uniref:response regulator n=1 Tax=Chitinophaga alhagiae TaxID=2203219 RepID=UPI0018E4E862|nr:response regulator transcription factor [Chitinophaga alhagiae]